MSKTAAEDLKIIATMLTRMKILKTMSKTITCHNSPWKSWFFRLTDSIKWHRQTAKESKREMDKELTKKRQNWHMKIQFDHQGRFHDSQFLETVMITAIYKKQWKPDIYRSICIFSMFYILFSTILYNRPYAKLGSCPFVDQALFRNNSRPRIIIFRTDLLRHTKRVVNWHVGGVCRFSEGFRFNATWCNSGDISRIFLSMSNTSICLLEKMYADQRATVLTWIRDLSWKKPGDPSSSFLPYSVLKDIGVWNEKGLGIKLGEEKTDCISNPRFAEDVLIVANSLKQLKRMMIDFR